MNQIESDVVSQRGKSYGPPLPCHLNIGYVWGGLLSQAGWIPPPKTAAVEPDLVALMLAALKIVRLATYGGEAQPDSFLDAHVYLRFAQAFQTGQPPEEMLDGK